MVPLLLPQPLRRKGSDSGLRPPIRRNLPLLARIRLQGQQARRCSLPPTVGLAPPRAFAAAQVSPFPRHHSRVLYYWPLRSGLRLALPFLPRTKPEHGRTWQETLPATLRVPPPDESALARGARTRSMRGAREP